MKAWLRNLWSSRKPGWRLLRLGLAVVVLLYLGLMLFENHLIFFPSKYPAGDWSLAPCPVARDVVLTLTDVAFSAADGTQLHGWWCVPQRRLAADQLEPVATDWTILYCHGNAGNLSDRKDKLACLAALPAVVFVFDYRGYGRSQGAPNERGLCLDVAAARQIIVERGRRADRLLVYGESIGGGPATELAFRGQAAGLVTDATFTSIPAMARVAYPFVPRFLVRTQFDNLAKLRQTACPKLIVHGDADGVIPFRMGEELFQAAAGPKLFFRVPGADHESNFSHPAFLDHWRQLQRLIEAPAAPPQPAPPDPSADERRH